MGDYQSSEQSDLPASIEHIANVEVTSYNSRDGRTSLGSKVKLGQYFQDVEGPVLLCFFRRLG
jgi:hypothetical protein